MATHEFSSDFSLPFDGMLTLPVFTTGARPRYAFPFEWGSESDLVSVVSVPVVTRWTTHACNARTWNEGVSTPRRFERIYTQPATIFGQSVNFAFRIQSQFPFRVETDSQVVITSTITSP